MNRWHDGKIHSVSFSPDGTKIVSSCDEGIVQVSNMSARWEVLINALIGPSEFDGSVLSVTFSPDSRYIYCGFTHGAVRRWDVQVGQTAGVLVDRWPIGSAVPMAFSPNVTSSSQPDKVQVWTWRRVTVLRNATI